MNANMIRSDKAIYELEWCMEDIFGNPHKLWYPKLKGFDYSSFGVYILWQPAKPYRKVIYAGKGVIKHRFTDHRRKWRIQKYHSPECPIYVTWAEVTGDLVKGVEKYLHNVLNPLECFNKPWAGPIPVNLPTCLN